MIRESGLRGIGVLGRIVIVTFALLWTTASASARTTTSEEGGGLSWEMPGRLSIYDLQFGPAVLKDKKWEFLGNKRTFNAGADSDRLTLMIRFNYQASRPKIPVRFVIKLPQARQYEETVNLRESRGSYAYHFTIHRPEDFVGSGSVYIYYGISIVDVLDFTILPKS
ncbi:MAG: hypothetical protein LDL33_06800 [Desulfomonile sp.]|nr:hypothetical protein [Desulfomonile sp.]